MDIELFVEASVAGVPLIAVIIGLVEWFKQFKRQDGTAIFEGNALLLISMGWGVLLGGLYMVAQQAPPEGDWQARLGYWLAVMVYGMAMGLVASGVYDAVKGLTSSNKR